MDKDRMDRHTRTTLGDYWRQGEALSLVLPLSCKRGGNCLYLSLPVSTM